MCKLLKVATPATALTVNVLAGVKDPVRLSTDKVIVSVLVVLRLLSALSIRTVTGGLIAAPAVVLVGCCPKATWGAATTTFALPLIAPQSSVTEIVRVPG